MGSRGAPLTSSMCILHSRSYALARLKSRLFSTNSTLSDPSPIPSPTSSTTFTSIGALKRIEKNLNDVFEVTSPTAVQSSLFPIVLSHRDMILKDATGSGKTFGLLAAILSKRHPHLLAEVDMTYASAFTAEDAGHDDEMAEYNKKQIKTKRLRYLATLFIVPTPELALQVYNWAKDMLKGVNPSDLSKHVQCILPQSSLTSQIDLVKPPTGPPWLLIGTPRRILDLIDNNAIDISRLQTVVLDEVDHLVRVKTRFETVKEKTNREKHPLYSEILMDRIVAKRRTVQEMMAGLAPNATVLDLFKQKSDDGKVLRKRAPSASLNRSAKNTGPKSRRLQVLICSATLNNLIRRDLERMRGYIVDPILIDDKGRHLSPSAIKHHAVIVDPTTKIPRNILTHEEEDALKTRTLEEAVEAGGKPVWVKRREEMALEDEDEAVLGIVAGIFKGLKVERGILFVNSNISIGRVTEKLRAMGVMAGRVIDEVDFTSTSSTVSSFFSDSNHILVVSEFTARGLDLPDVTHVVMLGPPSSPASYLHMSGRVGRFGKKGTAVTVLGGGRFEGKMLDMMKLLQVEPVPLGLLEG